MLHSLYRCFALQLYFDSHDHRLIPQPRRLRCSLRATLFLTLLYPDGGPAPVPEETLEETPAPIPEDSPAPSPEETPEETPASSPEETPAPTPEETPAPSPEETPAPIPEPTPEETLAPTPDPTPEPTLEDCVTPYEQVGLDLKGNMGNMSATLGTATENGMRGHRKY